MVSYIFWIGLPFLFWSALAMVPKAESEEQRTTGYAGGYDFISPFKNNGSMV